MAEAARSGDGGAGGASRRRRRRRRRSTEAEGAGGAGQLADGAKRAAARSGTGRGSGGRRPGRKAAKGQPSVAKGQPSVAKGTAADAGRGSGTARGGAGRSGARTASRKRSGATRARKPAPRQHGPRASTKREISAGGVVYRRDGAGIEVILASRRTRRGRLAWGLAKGGIEDGESMEDAAVREVREETGLRAEIESSLGETRYFYVWEDVRIRKTVHFFLMRHTGGDVADRDDEMEEVRWFPLERALRRAAYRGERDVLKRAAELLR